MAETIILSTERDVYDKDLDVYDNKFNISIPYTSLTNALLASLHLEQHRPAPYVDEFLAILRYRNFNVSEIKFKNCADIDRSVAEHRQAQARRRAILHEGHGLSLSESKLPFDVLARVIESITHDRRPLQNIEQPLSTELVASRLKALALTHRSLTLPAQRALGQRLLVHSAEHLAEIMRSPLLGPWTNELIINFPTTDHRFHSPPFSLHTDGNLVAYVKDLLIRAPNLRLLCIHTPDRNEEDGPETLREPVKTVGKMNKLEELWLLPKNQYTPAVDIEEICRAIRDGGMSSLRRLVVDTVKCGWMQFNGGDEETTAKDNSIRKHSLEELSLTNVFCRDVAPACLTWLISSSTLKSLTVALRRPPSVVKYFLMTCPSLPSLHTLRIQLTEPPSPEFFRRLFSSYSSSRHTPTFSLTSKLHTLHLNCAGSWMQSLLTSSTLSSLPPSIRFLRLGLFHIFCLSQWTARQWKAQEDELVQFVRQIPRGAELELLEITHLRPDGVMEWGELRQACDEYGCRFRTGSVHKAGFHQPDLD